MIPTDVHAVRVELAQGPAVLVQFRDIEREQEIEQRLRLTTTYVDALAHHTSTVALMLDRTGHVRFATDTALALLGADRPANSVRWNATARCGSVAVRPHGTRSRDRAVPVTAVQLAVRGDADPVWLEGSLERLRTSTTRG